MALSLTLTARVQAGHKLEIVAPELNEGDEVSVLVTRKEQRVPQTQTLLEFLDSLPPGPRSAPTWGELEASLREDRDSWDR